jgi:uncharacterized membrane protein YbhN (UPF0104 family)
MKAMFILAISSLIGSSSSLSGGLSTANSSMLGLMRLLISRSATLGGRATLLIRLYTLWFGLFIGMIAVLVYRTIQHTDIVFEQSDSREEQNQRNHHITSLDGRLTDISSSA